MIRGANRGTVRNATTRVHGPARRMNGACTRALNVLLLLAVGCASAPTMPPASPKRAIGFSAHGTSSETDRCKVVPGRVASEYDTSGDARADVRKVYVAINAGVDSRTVMICRQADVNGDGRKDVVRYYDDEGRSLREESDRDFDGNLDRALVFQDGQLQIEELDEDRDGKVDTKVFFEQGRPTRAERDLTKRSSAEQWHPDRWEYYEAGHMVRMGTDLDGDGRADRWARDASTKQSVLPTEPVTAAAGKSEGGDPAQREEK